MKSSIDSQANSQRTQSRGVLNSAPRTQSKKARNGVERVVVTSVPDIELVPTIPGSSTWSATISAPATPELQSLDLYATDPDATQDKLTNSVFTALNVMVATAILPRIAFAAFAVLIVLLTQSVWSQGTTITLPLQQCGLGTVLCASYSPDERFIASGGYAGVVLRRIIDAEPIRILGSPIIEATAFAFSPDKKSILIAEGHGGTKLFNLDIETGMIIREFSGHSAHIVSIDHSLDNTTILTGSRDYTAILWNAQTGAAKHVLSGHTREIVSVALSPNGDKALTGSFDKTAKLWDTGSGECLHTLAGHTEFIRSVAFSPDGTKVMTGSTDETARLWNAETGAEMLSLQNHGFIYSVAFSPDGTRILTGGTQIVLWDSATGSLIRVFSSDADSVRFISFSPDGTRVLTTSSTSGLVAEWNTETGKIIRIIEGHSTSVWSATFSPETYSIVTGSQNGNLDYWQLTSGSHVRSIPGHLGIISSVAFSQDGTKLLSGSFDYTVKLWNAINGEQIRAFSGHRGAIYSLAFSSDGSRMVTGSNDRSAILWNTSTGNFIRSFSGHAGSISSVAYSPDGSKIATGSYDNTAKVWNAATGAEIVTLFGHVNRVESVDFSPDGTFLLTGSTDKTACLWNVATADIVTTFSGHTSYVYAAIFSPDGTKIATGSADRSIKLWNAGSAECIRTITGHTGSVCSVAFSKDGIRLLSGSSDKTVKLWNIESGSIMRTYSGHTSSVESVFFSPDGARIISGSLDKTAKVWDTDTGAMIISWTGHTSDVWCAAFSPDGSKALTGSSDYTAKLWDSVTGEENLTFASVGSVNSVAFSPDDSMIIAGGGNKKAIIWNTNTGAFVSCFSGHTSSVQSVAFSPDGTKALTGSTDHTAILWDALTGNALQTFIGHTGSVLSVAFSKDGLAVLTGSGDKTAKLWDTKTGVELHTFEGHINGLVSVAFSPDGAKILTADWGDFDTGGSAKVWNSNTGELLCSYLGTFMSALFSPDGTKVLTSGYDGTAKIWELNPPRAVIVTGGGNYQGNGIAQQTDDLGAYAYKVLRGRGYEAGDIQYLTAFGPADPGDPAKPFRDADGDGINDVDGWANLANLEQTLTGDFATSAGRLLIIMVDHGNRTQDFMTFRVCENQVLPSTQLDAWLDTLQTNHPVDVTLVVDCCYSGKMVEDCRLTEAEKAGPMKNRKRIVLASTGANEEAVFLPSPDLTSFLYKFLGSAYMGNSMGESFRAGQRFFETFPVANQVPQMDDTTTGTAEADREFFGATWAYGVMSTQDINQFFPAFDSWTADTLIAPGEPLTLWTRMLPGQDPLLVEAVIRPPAPEVISGEPVTNLPRVSLHRKSDIPGNPDYRVWEATTTDIFTGIGAYTVSFTARFPYERLSNPVFSRITVSSGLDPDATAIRGILAIGETANPQLSTAFSGLGAYAYRVYLKRFQDNAGYSHPEWIEYLTPFPVGDRDGTPSSAAVLGAIAAIPLDVGRLYIHLIGESSAAGLIHLASGDDLSASALDAALDALQSRQECSVVLVVDAPYSGAFLPVCRATGAQQRVLMTGSRAGDGAVFLPTWDLTSFSQKFLAAGYQGNHLYQSYRSGDSFFKSFLRYYLTPRILPQLDDNGDGVADWRDGALAQTLYLGRRYAFAGDDASGLPFILDATTTQTVERGMPATYSARLVEGITPSRVFAQLVPPDTGGAGEIITAIPEIEFVKDALTTSTWSATFTAPVTLGTHSLILYAAYPDTPEDKLSDPFFTGLIVTASFSTPDAYEPSPYNDSTSATTQNVLEPNTPQEHTLHSDTDIDWGIVYLINPALMQYSLVFSNRVLPSGTALRVCLYEDGPDQPPTWIEDIGPGAGEYLVTWQGAGFSTLYYSVQALGIASPAMSYQIELRSNSGANNGLARAIGGNSMSVEWQNNTNTPPGAQGFAVVRSETGQEGSFAQVNATPIPIPGNLGNLLDYTDDGLQPVHVYFYRVLVIESGGGTQLYEPTFYGVTWAESPTPTPTLTPTPTATASPTPSPTPSATATASPTPSPSPTPGPSPTEPASSITLWHLFQ